jgi:hypothetical protein
MASSGNHCPIAADRIAYKNENPLIFIAGHTRWDVLRRAPQRRIDCLLPNPESIMVMHRHVLLAVAASAAGVYVATALVGSPLGATELFPSSASVKAEQRATKVPRVKAVTVARINATAEVDITAIGEVPTTGWSNPRLVGRLYIPSGPTDRILRFDFIADAPNAAGGAVVSELTVTRRETLPRWARTVRVCGSSNCVDKAVPR